jgi:hypothetical protein
MKNYINLLDYWKDFLKHVGIETAVGYCYFDEIEPTEEKIAEKGDY